MGLLIKYKDRLGNCDVPSNHKEDEKNLGNWLSDQRKLKKKRKLREEYQHRLEELGVVWDVLSQKWEDNFTLLIKYKDREGNCDVPRNHKEDEKNLGNWLNDQRKLKRKEKLSEEYQHRLEELGVAWDVLSQKWEDMFTLLIKYKDREGNCDVPQNHKEDEKNLGTWLSDQRQLKE